MIQRKMFLLSDKKINGSLKNYLKTCSVQNNEDKSNSNAGQYNLNKSKTLLAKNMKEKRETSAPPECHGFPP